MKTISRASCVHCCSVQQGMPDTKGDSLGVLVIQSVADPINSTIAEARRRFKAYQAGDRKAVHQSLRLAIFSIVVREGGESGYQAIRDEYMSTTSIDGKETCLIALGKVQSTSLVNDFLDFQFSENVAIQDLHTGSISLAANSKVRNDFWRYVKEHWTRVHNKLSANSVVTDRYLKTTLSKFASHDVERDIALFFKDKDTKGYDRGLVQVSDTVKANAYYKERDEQQVYEWLKTHGYA